MSKKQDKKRIRNVILVTSIIAIVVSVVLFLLQIGVLFQEELNIEQNYLKQAKKTLDDNSARVTNTEFVHHSLYGELAYNISNIFLETDLRMLNDAEINSQCERLKQIADTIGTSVLYIVDRDGTVVLSANRADINSNLLKKGYISYRDFFQATREDFARFFTDDGLFSADCKPISYIGEDKNKSIYNCYVYPIDYMFDYINDFFVILGEDRSLLADEKNDISDLSIVLDRFDCDNSTIIIAIDRDNRRFAFYDDGYYNLTGLICPDTIPEEIINNDNYQDFVDIGGTNYYATTMNYSSPVYGNLNIVALTSIFNIRNLSVVFWTMLAFVFVLIIIIVYAVILRTSGIKGRTLLQRILAISAIGLLFVSAISFSTLTLIDIAENMEDANFNLETIETKSISRTEIANKSNDYYISENVKVAKILANLYENNEDMILQAYDKEDYRVYSTTLYNGDDCKDAVGNPTRSIVNNKNLITINEKFGIINTYILNNKGLTISTSGDNWFYEINRSPNSDTYQLAQVIDRKRDYDFTIDQENNINRIAVHITLYPYKEGNYTYYDSYENHKNGVHDSIETNGLLIIERQSVSSYFTSTDSSLDYLISSVSANNGSNIYLIDKTDKEQFVYKPTNSDLNSVSDLNLPDAAFKNHFCGFTRSNGQKYLIFSRFSNTLDSYVVTAFKYEDVFFSRNSITSWTILFVAISVLIQAFTIYFLNQNFNNEQVPIKMRAPGKEVKWSDMIPEEKIVLILKVAFSLFGLILLFRIVRLNNGDGDSYILSLLLSNNYVKGLNILSIASCFLLIYVVSSAVTVLKFIINIVINSFFDSVKPVTSLIISIVQYAAIIFSILYCLYLLGFDTSNILASIGILSTIIGLGARSIINDIVAGIFMIIEGEFKVGDIVSIQSTKGIVQSVGLRTTKLLDESNNIKIISNSSISGVINMSQCLSNARILCTMEYNGSLEEAEMTLFEKLHLLEDNNDNILDTIQFTFSDFKDNTVNVILKVPCIETAKENVATYICRYIGDAFKNSNIIVLNTKVM